MHIAVIFDNIGPYHLARLKAVSRITRVTALEIAGRSEAYSWEPVRDTANVKRHTLFPGAESQQVTIGSLAAALRNTLAEVKPDVIAIPGWGDRSAIAALRWSHRAGIPVVLMSESTSRDAPRYWSKEIVKKRILSLVGATLTGGSRGKDYIAQLGMPANRIFVGYDVVDNEFFMAGAKKARNELDKVRKFLQLPKAFFLASARFVSKKNLARLLNAYAQYRTQCGSDSWKLVVLGDGPLREELLRQRLDLKLECDVIFPGFVQYECLPSYYGLAGAFVHASVVEQWGLVVNEALASALPVIVSDACGCMPELVRDGENGFSFDPTDADELASLLGLLSHASDLKRMSQMGERIIQQWSPARFAEGMLEAATTALAIGPLRPRRSDLLMLAVLANA